VSDTIYDWIGGDAIQPSDPSLVPSISRMQQSRTVKRVMARMVDRTLLEVDKKRVLKLFTMTARYYVLPERTSALVTQRSVRLLEECQRTRPDVYNQLTRDIANGFERRIEAFFIRHPPD